MAAKKKTLIRLVSTESNYFYVTQLSKDKKLQLRKFDPYLKKHVLFKEQKMK